jgi:hypothetical protein
MISRSFWLGEYRCLVVGQDGILRGGCQPPLLSWPLWAESFQPALK